MTADNEQRAWELERERIDTELADLRSRIRALEGYVSTLQDVVLERVERKPLHSARVEP